MATPNAIDAELGPLGLTLQELIKQLSMFQTQALTKHRLLAQGQKTPVQVLQLGMTVALGKAERELSDFHNFTLQKIYLQGARSVLAPGESFKPSPEALKRFQKMAQDSHDAFMRSLGFVQRDFNRYVTDVTEKNNRFPRQVFKPPLSKAEVEMQKRGTFKQEFSSETLSWFKKNQVRGIEFKDGRRYKLQDFGRMAGRAAGARAYNLGAADAMKQNGIKFVDVFDGPGCGWTSHHDSDLANGSVRTIAEAMAFPIAHPNCQRRFTPVRDPDRLKNLRGSTKASRREALLKAAAITGGVLAASEATNLAARAFGAALQTDRFDQVVRNMLQAGLKGDQLAMEMAQRINAVRNFFTNESMAKAEVIKLYPDLGPEDVILKATGSDTFQNPITGLIMKRLAPSSDANIFKEIGIYADRIVDGIRDIPEHVKEVLTGVQGAARFAGPSFTPGSLGKGVETFYRYAKRQQLGQATKDNLKRAIDFEVRQVGLLQKTVFKGTPLESFARGNWSIWGPRARVDLTEFFRAKFTQTRTGLVQTFTVAPKRALKGAVKIYQDGTVGGYLSLIPKQVFNGALRAILEVDEYGKLIGNIRLVPGGPLRIIVNFATPRPPQAQIAEEGLQAVTDFTDFRKFKLLEKAVKEAGDVNLTEVLRRDPKEALSLITREFGRLEFKGVTVEYRLFNKSVLDIHGNLRIPVDGIKRAIAIAKKRGTLKQTGNLYTGVLPFAVEHPMRFLAELIGPEGLAGKASIFGNIRFSGLQAPANTILKAAKKANVRLSNVAHIEGLQIKDVVSRMRIRGYSPFDIADVLKLSIEDVKAAIVDKENAVRVLLNDFGFRSLPELRQPWETRMFDAQRVMANSKGVFANRAEVIQRVTDDIALVRNRRVPDPVTVRLAGINKYDRASTIEAKLRAMVEMLKTEDASFTNMPRSGLTSADSAEFVKNRWDILNGLTPQDIRSKALDIQRTLKEPFNLRLLSEAPEFPDGFDTLLPDEQMLALWRAKNRLREGYSYEEIMRTMTFLDPTQTAASQLDDLFSWFAPQIDELDKVLGTERSAYGRTLEEIAKDPRYLSERNRLRRRLQGAHGIGDLPTDEEVQAALDAGTQPWAGNPLWARDLRRTMKFADTEFPNAPPVEFVVAHMDDVPPGTGVEGWWDSLPPFEGTFLSRVRTGIINFTPGTHTSWGHGRFSDQGRGAAKGWFVRNSDMESSTMVHELGHHLVRMLPQEQMDELLTRLHEADPTILPYFADRAAFVGPPHTPMLGPGEHAVARGHIIRDYGQYANRNLDEFMAEAFTDAAMSPGHAAQPGSQAIYDFLKETWGPDGKLSRGQSSQRTGKADLDKLLVTRTSNGSTSIVLSSGKTLTARGLEG